MTVKLIGAGLVIAGCGGWGCSMAAHHRRLEANFGQYLLAVEYMQSDLACRMTPLPQLCMDCANRIKGPVRDFFLTLSMELDGQAAPDVPGCVRSSLDAHGELPELLCQELEILGSTLGSFDLPGQIRGLEQGERRAQERLERLSDHRDSRLRSYQTLGLCAGAALAILFL